MHTVSQREARTSVHSDVSGTSVGSSVSGWGLSLLRDELSDEELCKVAGADVLTQTPEIRSWLLSLAPDKQMVVGSYIYLDGCARA
jgi:hypothetical protein